MSVSSLAPEALLFAVTQLRETTDFPENIDVLALLQSVAIELETT